MCTFKWMLHSQLSLLFCRMKVRQDNEMLKNYLKAAQDDITTLLDEKRTLMATIKSLQDQLTSLSDVQLGQQDGKR